MSGNANVQAIVTPAATTNTTLYTADWTEVISSIIVSNQSTSTTYSIHIVPSWESVWDDYAFPKWATIDANDVHTFTLWITPLSWTFISVVSTSGDVNFALFGKKR